VIKLKATESFLPSYATQASAGADLRSTAALTIPKQSKAKVPTGVWIDKVIWEEVPEGFVPELQIRARSGLAYKHGICLSNGVGTVDADYPDEICVLLWNSGDQDFSIDIGDRIAQVVVNLVPRLEQLDQGSQVRKGGFGSTGIGKSHDGVQNTL
jgi:dUTP pyrophosphatase